MSRKTSLTSTVRFSSNVVCTSGIMDNSWAIHQPPGRNPDREGVKSLWLRK